MIIQNVIKKDIIKEYLIVHNVNMLKQIKNINCVDLLKKGVNMDTINEPKKVKAKKHRGYVLMVSKASWN